MSIPVLDPHSLRRQIGSRGAETILLILGSGMSDCFDPQEYRVIGRLPSVREDVKTEGHPGIVALLEDRERPVLLSLGRRHLYEGGEPEDVVRLIDWGASLGIRKLFLTNAAGGLNPRLRTGDLMLHRGYLPALFGRRRLIGNGLSGFFPVEAPPFNPAGRSLQIPGAKPFPSLAQAALSEGIALREGIYAGVTGPNYETRAEIRMLRRMGADAVGMSTITEVEGGLRRGMRPVGLSLITNVASDTERQSVTHDEVSDASSIHRNKLRRLLEAWMRVSAGE